MAKILPASDFGLIALLNVFIIIADTLSTTGIQSALIQNNEKNIKNYSTAFITTFFISISLYLLFYFSSSSLALYFSRLELSKIIPYIFLSVIFNGFNSIYKAHLTVDLNFKFISLCDFTANITAIIISCYIAYDNGTYWALVFLPVIRSFTAFLIYFFKFKTFFGFLFDFDYFKKIMNFGYMVTISGVIIILTNNLVILLLGKYYSPEKLGHYALATTFVMFLSTTIGTLIQKVTYPILSQLKNDKLSYSSIFTRIYIITGLVSIPVLFGFSGVANEFVLVFLDEKWLPAIEIISLLAISKSLFPLMALNINLSNSLGFPKINTQIDVIKLILTLISLYFMMPYGLEVVIVGEIFITAFTLLLYGLYVGKFSDFGFTRQFSYFFPSVLASSTMLLLIYNLDYFSPLINLILKILIGGVIYTATVMIFGKKLVIENIKRA